MSVEKTKKFHILPKSFIKLFFDDLGEIHRMDLRDLNKLEKVGDADFYININNESVPNFLHKWLIETEKLINELNVEKIFMDWYKEVLNDSSKFFDVPVKEFNFLEERTSSFPQDQIIYINKHSNKAESQTSSPSLIIMYIFTTFLTFLTKEKCNDKIGEFIGELIKNSNKLSNHYKTLEGYGLCLDEEMAKSFYGNEYPEIFRESKKIWKKDLSISEKKERILTLILNCELDKAKRKRELNKYMEGALFSSMTHEIDTKNTTLNNRLDYNPIRIFPFDWNYCDKKRREFLDDNRYNHLQKIEDLKDKKTFSIYCLQLPDGKYIFMYEKEVLKTRSYWNRDNPWELDVISNYGNRYTYMTREIYSKCKNSYTKISINHKKFTNPNQKEIKT